MKSDERSIFALLVLMVAVGAGAWWMQLRPRLEVEPAPLESLPLELGPWSGRKAPLSDAVEQILMADYNMQRAYHREGSDDVVWLYVGYYGTSRGGRPEHTPEVCYPSAGWTIESPGVVASDVLDTSRSTLMRVSLHGEQRLVQYWYRSPLAARRASRLGLSFDHLLARLRGSRADGALVRISTPIRDGREHRAAARLADFGQRVEAELERHWPAEAPAR